MKEDRKKSPAMEKSLAKEPLKKDELEKEDGKKEPIQHPILPTDPAGSVSEKPWVIAITGSMGSGKSMVRTLLQNRIPTMDCDSINAALLKKEAAGWKALKEAGLLYARESGEIDRQAMADAMFGNPALKVRVESILHRLILSAMQRWIDQQKGLCAVEVPLLFEAGLEKEFDEIWCVMVDQKTALERLEKGRHIGPDEALRRLASQMDPAIKAEKSDAVLYNDGTIADLQAQIDALLANRSAQTPA